MKVAIGACEIKLQYGPLIISRTRDQGNRYIQIFEEPFRCKLREEGGSRRKENTRWIVAPACIRVSF
jgi:hypothetical protein